MSPNKDAPEEAQCMLIYERAEGAYMPPAYLDSRKVRLLIKQLSRYL